MATLHSEDYRRFLAEIRAVRASADLSQAALAERLSKPPSYVAKSELGERRLDVLEMLAWCRACDSDPLAFLKRIIRAVDEAIQKT